MDPMNTRRPLVWEALTQHYPEKAQRYTAEIKFAGAYTTQYDHGTSGHLGYVAIYWMADLLEDYLTLLSGDELGVCRTPDEVYNYLRDAFGPLPVAPHTVSRILDEVHLAVFYAANYSHGTPGALTYEVLAALFDLFLRVEG